MADSAMPGQAAAADRGYLRDRSDQPGRGHRGDRGSHGHHGDDGDLPDLLARWLPCQRWFPGRLVSPLDLAIVSDVPLLAGNLRAGQPTMRHLVVAVPVHGEQARFQVLVGYRAELPSSLRAALIGEHDGVACYDALHDPELADALLQCIIGERRAGPVRFVRAPDAPRLAAPGGRPDGRLLGVEQSNTSLVFGQRAILKVLRRLFPGANPDLEVAEALARIGSARVAAPYGWIEAGLGGERVLLGVLSQYLAGASDGWTLALSALRILYARHGAYSGDHLAGPLALPATAAFATASGSGTAGFASTGGAAPVSAEPAELAADAAAADLAADTDTRPQRQPGEADRGRLPFADEAWLLGHETAQLHAELARAFGSRGMTATEFADLTRDLHGKLSDAVALVPDLRSHESRIRAAYDDVADLAGPVPVQRIHGDYHLGQVLRAAQGWVALDFEGEPSAPLEVRRAPAPALKDVAGMLRSFDYAAKHQLVGRVGADADHAERLAAVAESWVRQCQDAFTAGYASGGGTDPVGHSALLRALTLEKAVYEVVYEYWHRPSWLPIPLGFLATA